MLGVTDKSVSKWENGICLPDVSLYKKICNIFDITLNEFFAGEKLTDESFKKVADYNLFSVLENSVFTLKDKLDFFREKWQKEHFFELILVMIILVFFILYGFIQDNGLQYLFMIVGLIIGMIEKNKMKVYVERNVFGEKSNLSISEFRVSLQRMKELKEVISQFETKKEAIDYLIQETGLSKEECISAYDFIQKIDFDHLDSL